MSDNKENLDNKLVDAKKTAQDMLKAHKAPIIVSQESVVEVAKKHSAKDIFLWVIAISAIIMATLVSDQLPKYWAAASDIWVQVGVTVGLVVLAFICLAFTNQGSAFKTLLKDSGVELRRVTWPSKQETITYTWQVVVVVVIVGIMVWLLDIFFTEVVGYILG